MSVCKQLGWKPQPEAHMSQFLTLIEVIGPEKDIGTCQGLQICKYD